MYKNICHDSHSSSFLRFNILSTLSSYFNIKKKKCQLLSLDKDTNPKLPKKCYIEDSIHVLPKSLYHTRNRSRFRRTLRSFMHFESVKCCNDFRKEDTTDFPRIDENTLTDLYKQSKNLLQVYFTSLEYVNPKHYTKKVNQATLSILGAAIATLLRDYSENNVNPKVVLDLLLHILNHEPSFLHTEESIIECKKEMENISLLVWYILENLFVNNLAAQMRFCLDMLKLQLRYQTMPSSSTSTSSIMTYSLFSIINESLQNFLQEQHHTKVSSITLVNLEEKKHLHNLCAFQKQMMSLSLDLFFILFDNISGLCQVDSLCRLSNLMESIRFDLIRKQSLKKNKSQNQHSINLIRISTIDTVRAIFAQCLSNLLEEPLSKQLLDSLSETVEVYKVFNYLRSSYNQNLLSHLKRSKDEQNNLEDVKTNFWDVRLSSYAWTQFSSLCTNLLNTLKKKKNDLEFMYSALSFLLMWRPFVQKHCNHKISSTNLDKILLELFLNLMECNSNSCEFYTELFNMILKFYNPKILSQTMYLMIEKLNKTIMNKMELEVQEPDLLTLNQLSQKLNNLNPFARSNPSLSEYSNTLLSGNVPEPRVPNFLDKTHNATLYQLRLLEELTYVSDKKFPIRTFENEGGGALLTAILQFKIRQNILKKNTLLETSNTMNCISEQTASFIGVILDILANISARMNSIDKSSQWIFHSWKQCLHIQSTLAHSLICNQMIPKPLQLNPLTKATNSALIDTEILLKSKKPNYIPPSHIYYNSKRLQLNIEQLLALPLNDFTPRYNKGIIPLYVKDRDERVDALNLLLEKNHNKEDLAKKLHEHTKSVQLFSEEDKVNEKTAEKRTPVDVVLIHGLRGSAFKTWRWLHDEPWSYNLSNSAQTNNASLPEIQKKTKNTLESVPTNIFEIPTEDMINICFVRESDIGRERLTCEPYTIDVHEPGTEETWYFHWPQLFLRDSLSRGSRIISVHLDIPLFKHKSFIRRKNSQQLSDMKTFVPQNFQMPNLASSNFFFKTINSLAIKETLENFFLSRGIFEANFQDISKSNIMTNTDRSLAQLAEVVKMRLEESNIVAKKNASSYVTEHERHIVWITHSMGGLILKYLLLSDERFAKSTRAIVFLGVPHFGSPISEEFQYLSRFAPLYCQELHPTWFKYSFNKLNENFTQLCLKHKITILSMAETIETPLPYVSKILTNYKRHIVPPPFANPEYGIFFMLPYIDHQRICYVSRPDDRISLMKQLIKLSTKKKVSHDFKKGKLL